jgi:hypothetical protein
MVPIVASATEVGNGDDDKFAMFLDVHNAEGKLPENVPASLRLYVGPCLGEGFDLIKTMLKSSDKSMT